MDEFKLKKDDDTLKEMILFYGIENIPNPEHYPLCFEFLVKSYEHMKRMQHLETHGKSNESY